VKKLLAIVLLLTAHISVAQQVPKIENFASGLKAHGTSYSAFSGKNKLWEIHAKKIESTQEKAKASGITGTLYSTGKPRYYMKSPVAFINVATNDIFFPEGVILHGKQGEEVTVSTLTWRAKEKKFYGAKGVVMVHLNTKVQGDRMVLDQTMKDIRIKGHVKAEVKP